MLKDADGSWTIRSIKRMYCKYVGQLYLIMEHCDISVGN